MAFWKLRMMLADALYWLFERIQPEHRHIHIVLPDGCWEFRRVPRRD